MSRNKVIKFKSSHLWIMAVIALVTASGLIGAITGGIIGHSQENR